MTEAQPDYAALEAERDRLKQALDDVRAAAGRREPPSDIVAERIGGQWAILLGSIGEVEADLLRQVAVAFLAARQLRIETGLPGATIVRADEGGGRLTVRGSIEVHTPRHRTA